MIEIVPGFELSLSDDFSLKASNNMEPRYFDVKSKSGVFTTRNIHFLEKSGSWVLFDETIKRYGITCTESKYFLSVGARLNRERFLDLMEPEGITRRDDFYRFYLESEGKMDIIDPKKSFHDSIKNNAEHMIISIYNSYPEYTIKDFSTGVVQIQEKFYKHYLMNVKKYISTLEKTKN